MHATPTVRVGMIGTGFMCRAHSHALNLLATLENAPAALPRLTLLCGRREETTQAVATRLGWEHITSEWRDVVADADVDALCNTAPNHLHAIPSIAALEQGKHVLCEKPLGATLSEAADLVVAARSSTVVSMCAFNYRFFPAIALARRMIAEGAIGEITHFRSRFLMGPPDSGSQLATSWRAVRQQAGSGVTGDMASHHIDLARVLVGEIVAVTALMRSDHSDPDGLEATVCALLEFANGATGTIEASRLAPGHALTSTVEVDGTAGGLAFSVQRCNELAHHEGRSTRTINVTAPGDPWMELWWPNGHPLGWSASFVNELRHFLGATAGAWKVAPDGATFADGLAAAAVCEAITLSARLGTRVRVSEALDQRAWTLLSGAGPSDAPKRASL